MTGTGEARFARAGDGTVLQYEVAGAGEPIVFLHGGFASRSAFATTAPKDFATSSRPACATCADMAVQPAPFPPTSDRHDRSHRPAAVLDAEGIERAHLVGHSTGGVIAFCFGLAHPGANRPACPARALAGQLDATGRLRDRMEAIDRSRRRAKAERSQAALGEILKLILGDSWETQAPLHPGPDGSHARHLAGVGSGAGPPCGHRGGR